MSIIYLIIIALICLCIWKIQGIFDKWLTSKFGKVTSRNVWFISALFWITLLFVMDHYIVGFVFLGILLAAFVAFVLINKSLLYHYMLCYCISKKEKVNYLVQKRSQDVMNSIWESGSPKLRVKIKKAIEQEELECQGVTNDGNQ